MATADEPQRFSPDAFAQPIAASSEPTPVVASHEPPATGAPLRWKSKQIGTMRIVEDTQRVVTNRMPARGWNKTRADGQVRPVQGLSSDPFSDPFGDRNAVRRASDIELEPTDAEANRPGATATQGVEELPAPVPSRAPPSAPSAPRQLRGFASPSAEPIDNSYIAQPPTPAPDLTPQPRTSEGELPAGPAGPCERIYNDRNCCDIEAGCKAFREQLIADSIRAISLDITPRFMPDLSIEEDEAKRMDKLRLLESRTWRGRRGEVLATGRMTNLKNGRVVLTDDSGNEVASLPWGELGDDEVCYINAYWRLPVECTLGGRQVVSRHWLASTWQWQASALCHKPLYFEEVQLERYGHTTGPYTQPWVSGAHFFLNIAALPYHMAYQPPHECQYALGYYRPGSCAPWMIPPVPISFRGAAAEAIAIVGGVYLIP
ncbi:MAG: hypothetical protein L0211_12535 [Planctomycetaceae bacterium]|nr:hypothetical protein [Planctomycetaceae bacterium]